MPYLLVVSLVWAASFGLIKHYLTGVDPDVVNAIRLALTFLVFAPFLRLRGLEEGRLPKLVAIGAVQFGAMYALYTRSYGVLKAHEVALATVMTPIYVTLLDDLLERRFRPVFLACALVSVTGTGVCLGAVRLGAPLNGLALVQLANLCFAVGQVFYRRLMADAKALPDREAFAWCAAGGAAVAVLLALPRAVTKGFSAIGAVELFVLVYLGVVASGLCFFLWNLGARRVNTGVLAVMNDLKIPLGIAVSLLVFGERADWPRLTLGGALIVLAWWMAARQGREAAALA